MTFRSHHRLLFLVGLRTKFALLFVVSPAFLLGLVQLSPEARAQSNWGRQVDQQQQAVGSNRRDYPAAGGQAPRTARAQQRYPQQAHSQTRQPLARQPQARPASARGGAATQPTRSPAAGVPFQLTQKEQQFLDQVLNYWEHRSQKVKTFRCKFTRWEYDPVFGPKDPGVAKTQSEGEIKYAEPDKGLFRVDSIAYVQPPATPGGEPRYAKREGEILEHWVCDGRSIYQFDAQKKQLIERTLPAEMHGRAITNGPLPFMFGAEADKIKQRYWIRPVPPPQGVTDEYWLQAYPKRREDAANFKMVEVILDQELFLPKAVQVYDPNYHPQQNQSRTVYVFGQRKVNEGNLLSQLNLFHREFYEPRTPLGWKKITERYDGRP